MNDSLNITPEPQVLLALTNTPLSALDAICELVDNGIDAFRAASLGGNPVENPWVQIQIPGEAEVRRGEGIIRITDNGAGLDRQGLRSALTAGFSSKNAFDTLGLFGMGFNIASGKLGKRTTVTTIRKGDRKAIRTVLDLPELVRTRSFELSLEEVEKPKDLDHGTIVEISGWWPEGTENAGFAQKLAAISKPVLAKQLGRRYASILRRTETDRVSMRLNDIAVKGFEHCVWDSSRFVERQGWGQISAKIEFDQILHSQRQCLEDRTLIVEGESTCSQCGGVDFKVVNERVKGWIGVQRFDDADNFGIDVIRNGRTILVAEKDAFFSITNELGMKSREYPSDSIYGRIVGEVQLDHVPVDFTKQNFQRSSDSWVRAMDFIRGKSLLEGKWEDGYRNDSPVGLIFKGYRKVRKPGREDMYMGRYDESTRRAVRIGRDVERDYYAKFENGEVGYYDDAMWWELVEAASHPPIRGLVPCPDCGYQNTDDDETCADCSEILRGKNCIQCGIEIRQSATLCESCGVSQVPEVVSPWNCNVCSQVNSVDDEQCVQCASLRGALNPVDIEELKSKSIVYEDYCVDTRTFEIVPNIFSQPIEINTHSVPADALKPIWNQPSIPIFSVKNVGKIDVFVDTTHPIFDRYRVQIGSLVSIEVAQYLLALTPDIPSAKTTTIANLGMRILTELWSDEIVSDDASLRDRIVNHFASACEALIGTTEAVDFYENLNQEELEEMTRALIAGGRLEDLEHLRSSGKYLAFVPYSSLVKFFVLNSNVWFEKVWSEPIYDSTADGNVAILEAKHEIVQMYTRALEDCVQFLEFPYPNSLANARVKASIDFLLEQLK